MSLEISILIIIEGKFKLFVAVIGLIYSESALYVEYILSQCILMSTYSSIIEEHSEEFGAFWNNEDWDYNGNERIRKGDIQTDKTSNQWLTQLQIKDEEFKRERTLLQQKIELLSSEVAEYQEKQFKNKQLNESIILTYRQNESFREQLNQREL